VMEAAFVFVFVFFLLLPFGIGVLYYILAHSGCKMWIILEQKKVALWNKRYYEEKNRESAACLKFSVLIFVEKKYIKCNIWRLGLRPSYIWDARFLRVKHHYVIHTLPECLNACIVDLL
jgi:lambda repressor-like predicted transcriptional regulator